MNDLHGPAQLDSPGSGWAHEEHTADAVVRGWGCSPGDAVRQVLSGMVALMTGPAGPVCRQVMAARISAPDRVSAMVRAGNELLYWLDTEAFLPAAVQVHLSDDEGGAGSGAVCLVLTAGGEVLAAAGSAGADGPAFAGTVPKAATYHQAAIEPAAALPWRWVARLTLDL